MSKELSEEELGLILDRLGAVSNPITTGVIDSKHHSYTIKKRIKILQDVELSDEDVALAYEQFKKDLDEE
jgi:hypothetical protein